MYAYIQDVPIPKPVYDRIIDGIGPQPVAGSLLHLCVRREDGGLRYIDVWDSEESCTKAFDERIHPAVDAALGGHRPATEPEVHTLEVLHASGSLLPVTVPAG